MTDTLCTPYINPFLCDNVRNKYAQNISYIMTHARGGAQHYICVKPVYTGFQVIIYEHVK